MNAACMGLYATGPFTRVDFFLEQGVLRLAHSREPEPSGSALHVVSSPRYVLNPYWRLA